jgi:CheY-like chemotaxis protein
MPEMDGIEAARIIRSDIDSEYAKTVPIIALTANAIVGNEEMFLKNGFQAFLPKPIEIARLDNVINEWVRDEEVEKKLNAKFLNFGEEKLLDTNKGLERFGGDDESYMQVLRSYAKNTPQLLNLMKNVNKDNLIEYSIAVHGMKGSSRGICSFELGTQAEALEKAAKAGNLNYVKANNEAFLDLAGKLLEQLDEIIKQADSENIKQKKDKPDDETLKELMIACEAFDMDGVDSAMAELDKYEYESDSGLVAWLKDNVALMNLVQIKEKLANE